MRLVWLAPLWTFLGGGSGVIGALVFTMITDVVDISQRLVHPSPAIFGSILILGFSKSSTAFVFVSLSLQISQIVAPLMASWMMAASPWLAYIASIIVITLGLPILLIFLPETLSVQPSISNTTPSADHLERESTDTISVDQEQSDADSDSELNTLSTRLSKVLCDFHFLNDRNILILLSSFCLYWLGRSQMDLLILYVSTRYGQSLAPSGLVMSMNAILSLILFLIILPPMDSYFQKFCRMIFRQCS